MPRYLHIPHIALPACGNALDEKETSIFVLCSTFRNFGFAELTLHSKMKRKVNFPFAFRSFIRNFAVWKKRI